MSSQGSLGHLAGFYAAHAVWCVSDGATLIPLVGFSTANTDRKMTRFVSDDLTQAVAMGRDWLAKNPEQATMTVLVIDAFITLESGKIDALLLEMRDLTAGIELTMAVPYRNAESPRGFAVHKPKVLEWNGEPDALNPIVEAFFDGVDQHEQGAAVWNARIDQSI